MKALAVTASILLSVLALGIAGLTFFPSPDMGEPVAIIPVDPSTRPAPQSPPAPAAENAPDAEPGTPAGNQRSPRHRALSVEGLPNDTLQTRSFPEPPCAAPQRAPQQPELPAHTGSRQCPQSVPLRQCPRCPSPWRRAEAPTPAAVGAAASVPSAIGRRGDGLDPVAARARRRAWWRTRTMVRCRKWRRTAGARLKSMPCRRAMPRRLSPAPLRASRCW